MFMILNKQFVFMVFITMASGMAPFRRQTSLDKICFETRSTLCVNSTLMGIRKAAIYIEEIADDIEQGIKKNMVYMETYARIIESVESKITSSHPYLPKTTFHDKLLKVSNIDKELLGQLVKEMNYAMTFYYNSIDIMINNKLEKRSIESSFQNILSYLRSDIICPLRNIMAVYSLEWPFSSQVKHISYPKDHDKEAGSTAKNAYAIFIARLLKKWTKMIRHVIDDINGRYY